MSSTSLSPSSAASSPSQSEPCPDSPLADQAESLRVLAEASRIAQQNARRNTPSPLGQPRVALPADHDDLVSKRQREQDQRERSRRIELLLADCGVDARYARLTPDCWREVPELIDEGGSMWQAQRGYRRAMKQLWALLEQPRMVALLGRRGPGKTAMAAALVLDCCRRGIAAKYIDAMDYFLELQETYDDQSRLRQSQVEAKYLRPQLLVLDALEERADTAWNDRMLIRLVDKRYKAQLATVLISNEQEPAFRVRVGPTIADRLFDDAGGIIVCDWPSLRGRIQSQKGAE